MIYLAFAVILIMLILGPQWWVRYVLNKHSNVMHAMPGTGGELATHLLEKFELSNVKLEAAEPGADHYDPQSNTVRLSPEYLNGKSLTAIAVAAHEVGHAIQFNRNEPVSFLRKRYLGHAHRLQKWGIFCLMALPIIGAIVKIPHFIGVMAIIGLLTMLTSVFIYAAILPEEWDASFNKALPILKKGEYVPDEYLPAIRQILKACALTYVAAALADILRLWRWVSILKYLR
ncbi:zinc metallopeptidase [Aliikangiella maris]|uniref:Zinc metallopeptidase n=2 Tax=Aliikangiella maris TaxID=3162458 RepID=A0ABV2BNV9_9GAMM